MPSFFYFDLGNVLLKFDHEIACRQLGELTGLTPAETRAAIFTSGLNDRYETGAIECDQFYDEFCQATGKRPDRQAFVDAFNSIFTINAPTAPVVARLFQQRYRLGILSNTCRSHWNYVTDGRYVLIREAFELYALSFELKAMKPDRQIYDRAAEMAGVPAGEIFFVDDRPENVAGAIAAGWDAVLFTTAQQLARELRTRGVKFNL